MKTMIFVCRHTKQSSAQKTPVRVTVKNTEAEEPELVYDRNSGVFRLSIQKGVAPFKPLSLFLIRIFILIRLDLDE
jgi:hypothetical protein